MDLKKLIENSTLISKEQKEKLLVNFDKLTEEQKQGIIEALDVRKIYEQARKQIEKEEKKFVKNVTYEIEEKEDVRAEKNLNTSLSNL
ncbi:hypothetical protein HOG17_00930 [Candidatus Peregrinibacteria bacterium]|jgi:hypothetical protein|nr:hypothetical protein [Candidatus Peregrinibacteria bacterium]MBT4148583.1 hypothetical protein [Candidatus Peregrinibacteria bacterium]MBT4366739.1 hypothetical protein [Candidatus Peregrinibacteria bacterium]MBT4456360.1 hypothetical protein [Candidatus Peregrinibacteria bacterium]